MSAPGSSRLRRLARGIRHAPDRMLHPLRRRAARRALGAARPGVVLVLCHGNICRSPYAQAVLDRERTRLGSSGSVISAGFILPGRPPPEPALEVAATRGLDLSGHRSRAVTEEMVREAAVIVVMERWQRRKVLSLVGRVDAPVLLLGDLDPEPIIRRAIQDPIDRPLDVFEHVFSRIDACCAELAARWIEAQPSRG